mmetsp:Transcript_59525/g.192570  ORF Transcript_59525/g.192570 Transcript_59525/m.192570 type:complete len:140 (+) Transcript_59525:232-651(+)
MCQRRRVQRRSCRSHRARVGAAARTSAPPSAAATSRRLHEAHGRRAPLVQSARQSQPHACARQRRPPPPPRVAGCTKRKGARWRPPGPASVRSWLRARRMSEAFCSKAACSWSVSSCSEAGPLISPNIGRIQAPLLAGT